MKYEMDFDLRIAERSGGRSVARECECNERLAAFASPPPTPPLRSRRAIRSRRRSRDRHSIPHVYTASGGARVPPSPLAPLETLERSVRAPPVRSSSRG